MMFSAGVLSVLALNVVQAMGYDPTCSDNLVVYWGQNSYGAQPQNANDMANWQKTVSTYCEDTVIDVIPIAFICGTGNGVFPGSNLANCQFLAAGIQACQAKGKLVTISLGKRGGQTSSVLSSDAQGVAFANTIWNLFLGGSSSTRPFGSAVLDGVDLDIEVGAPTGYAAFATQIRTLSAGASKPYYITAAPQCPFPDAHIGSALNMAFFDAVYVQFYNNFCEVSNQGIPADWDYSTWDNWAKTVSPNPNVKVFIGAPASPSAGAGYVDATTLGSIALQTRAQFSSFGGIMLWDASQAYANGRFDVQVKNIIAADGCSVGPGEPNGCAQTYTVVSGDTCSAIESKTGVSDAQLHSLNPAINSGCTNLAIGQTLCVKASPGSGCTQTYTVVSGDTCSAIESKTGVSDAQLHSLNPAINSGCTNLAIGQTLCIQAGTGGGCTQTYTVVSGDTCAAIESKTGVSDAQLHSLNPAINSGCTNLQIGQTLCV
ncbi:Glycoside hydrolase family 18 protein [Mycena venus]|uniref:chitinase n=1 Tax=Mycena venus TaxID=2733690 RepID=A0A8H6YEV7_9AGAR|nr:Glycoside hydrolase family 18 protein [Mycena venus]